MNAEHREAADIRIRENTLRLRSLASAHRFRHLASARLADQPPSRPRSSSFVEVSPQRFARRRTRLRWSAEALRAKAEASSIRRRLLSEWRQSAWQSGPRDPRTARGWEGKTRF